MKPLKDYTEEDVLELQIRLDGVFRKMIFGTFTIFILTMVGSGIYHLFQ